MRSTIRRAGVGPGRGYNKARVPLLAPLMAAAALTSARAATDDPALPDTPPPRYQTTVVAPPAGREDAAASASVVTRDRTPRSAETLPQLLSELPGVMVTRLGGLGSLATLSIRGSAAHQVQVYLDGVPLASATWGSVDLGALPVADLERIEVYRGQAPVAFGASALGGVVSLTSDPPRAPGAAAEVGGGSFGTRFGGARATIAAGQRLRLALAVRHLASDGDFSYRSDNGTAFDPGDDTTLRRENNAVAQTDALVRLAIPAPGGRALVASLSYLHRDKGVPAPALFRSYDAGLGTRRLLGHLSYRGDDDLGGGGGSLRLLAYGSASEQEFNDARGEVALRPTHTHDRTTTFGATATGRRPLAAWLRPAATLDARHERFISYDEFGGGMPTAPPGTRTAASAGVELPFLAAPAALEVIPSARFEAARDAVVDRSLFGDRAAEAVPHTYLVPTARLAVLWRPAPGLVLRANAGRAARLPTMFERYGNAGTVLGNPTLRPETGFNADLGTAAAWGDADATGVSADAALFAARVHDLIDFQQGGGVQRARNVGEARILGAEVALAARAGGHVRLVGQGTFTDARDVGAVSAGLGRRLPHRPRLRLYGRPEARRLPLLLGWRAGLHADVDVTSGNYLDAANLVAVPARVLVGAGASVESPRSAWRIVVSAQNLGDARIHDLAGFPLPGRSLFLTLQWSTTTETNTDKETVP